MAVNRSFSARPAPALIKADCRRKVALQQQYMGSRTSNTEHLELKSFFKSV